MFLGNPVFPVSFRIEQVAELVEKTLLQKNWKSFKKGEIKLVLTPFYSFYYDAAFEEEGKLKKETEHGRLALNGETAELSKELADSMPTGEKLSKEMPDDYPLIVRKPIFSKKEAEKVALLKTASLIGTSREHIVLTGFEMVYYPMWLAFVTVGEETYELEISAITGEIFGEERVPEREKGFVEVTKATLSELKEPGAWIRYSKEIMDITGEKLSGGGEGQTEQREQGSSSLPGMMHRPWFWITLILLIVLIALMFYP